VRSTGNGHCSSVASHERADAVAEHEHAVSRMALAQLRQLDDRRMRLVSRRARRLKPRAGVRAARTADRGVAVEFIALDENVASRELRNDIVRKQSLMVRHARAIYEREVFRLDARTAHGGEQSTHLHRCGDRRLDLKLAGFDR
jgi:hypothetical protein